MLKSSRVILSVLLSFFIANYSFCDVCCADAGACEAAHAALQAAEVSLESAAINAAIAAALLVAASALLLAIIAACAESFGLTCLWKIAEAVHAFVDASNLVAEAAQALAAAIQGVQAAQAAVAAACTSPEPGGNPEGRSGLKTQGVFEGSRIVNIKPNTSMAMFLLNSEDKSLSMKLRSPNDTSITPLSNNSLNYYGKVNTTTYYLILNPAPGVWTMEIKPFWAGEKGKNFLLLAYTFENSTDATFNDYYSDHGVDDDGNGLYDHIDVTVGVNAKHPGWYTVSGTLFNDSVNETIFAFNKTYLEQGNSSQTLKFYGMHHPGSYYLKNLTLETVVPPKRSNEHQTGADRLLDYLEGDRGTQDFRVEAYATKPYDKFDWPINMPWVTRIIGNYSGRCVDVDNDSLYEILKVDVGVNIAEQGEYTLTGFLYDLNKSEVAWAIDKSVFEPGRRTMKLNFDSSSIEKHGVNGPYRLGNLSLWGKNWTIIDSKSYDYNTSAYNHSDFQR